ncbi:ZIP family metal transporter [Christiangramia forsetii]|uniref:ZIP family metal transporter n=2 Tax=Christiangramia forsetii TaxID=411153 RepID=A0M6K6_CHRFK|nr:ZIP family metal transporter [Christiangramia forsetii]GGG30177.1 divalent cation transporter [Christiangramia forsetii]CAL68251.1 ZIP family metal transporter [Christiangramia forsetii KT0803]
MEDIYKIILYSAFSGITVFIGGLLSKFYGGGFKTDNSKAELFHFITAFGGGILVAAIALVLVPRGMEKLNLPILMLAFITGAFSVFFIDRKLQKSGNTLSQLLAMLLDFIPEAIALGAIFATDPKTGILLAIFIGLQNLPESFNSFQDLKSNGLSDKKSLIILFFLSFSGILGAIIGYLFLKDLPQVTAFLMVFASGGILYLIFQDIAPNVKLKKSWLPALGANLGFLIGMIGEKLIQ